MVGIENAEKLCFLAAVLKSYVRSYDWDNSGVKKDVSEIQCMTFANTDVIYIAGNKLEHVQILRLLNAYGVLMTTDLMNLVALSHHLSKLTHGQKNTAKLTVLSHKYSPTETKIVGSPDFTPALTALPGDQLTGMSTLLVDANKHQAVITANTPSSGARAKKSGSASSGPTNIANDLSQFKVTHAGKKVLFLCKILGATPPADYAIAPPTLSAIKTAAESVASGFTVHVIENNDEVHAELALLKFFTQGVLDGTFAGATAVQLGGLKCACRHCRDWIDQYATLFKPGSELTLTEADEGGRTERQNNAGHCPTLAAIPSTRLFSRSTLFAKLFGSAAIEGIDWTTFTLAEPVIPVG